MNKQQLKKEGEKWVKDGIITDAQLDAILGRYVKKDQSYLLVLFAVLLVSIGILIFAFSDLTQVPPIARVLLMIVFMAILYFFGHRIYDQESQANSNSSHIYGVSFILLGYMFFGATLLLIVNVYEVTLFNVWPLVIWSFVGLLLYAIYEHRYILTIGLLITIISQLYSALAFTSFDFILFIIFMFGYFHYVFHHANKLFSYIFTIGLSIQLVILTVNEIDQYYWFLIFSMAIYLLAQLIEKQPLKRAFFYISIWTILLFKMYESFLLQEEYFVQEIEMQPIFFIVWAVSILLIFVVKWKKLNRLEYIDLILFLPFFFLPFNYIFIIITMFFFSLYWLIIGFQRNMGEKITIGIIGFLISTFTVYIQFAWETLNRSLFFLIGGILLFVISFVLERKRRTSAPLKGDDE